MTAQETKALLDKLAQIAFESGAKGASFTIINSDGSRSHQNCAEDMDLYRTLSKASFQESKSLHEAGIPLLATGGLG